MHNFDHDHEGADCIYCKNHLPFKLPDHLKDSVKNGNAVIFAGAGVSTESPTVTKYPLYKKIAAELGSQDSNVDFPILMENYSNRPDGRLNLIKTIVDHIEHIRFMPELYRSATRFHKELSTIGDITTIVTTNWDNFFETECHATPFVFPNDTVFWDAADRKVLKIHGTYNNYSSIVATQSDYDRCRNQLKESLIGGKLKELLATKTILFVGYSMRDYDFLEICHFVRDQVNGLGRQSYIITLDDSEESLAHYANFDLVPLVTDGTYFLSCLKKALEDDANYMPDRVYEGVIPLLREAKDAHSELFSNLNIFDNPEIVHCASYQDGLIHGLEKISSCLGTGKYSSACYVSSIVKGYENLRKQYRKSRNYYDMAYVTGYQAAFLYLLLVRESDDIIPPLFYAVGDEACIYSIEDYLELLPEIPDWHRTAHKEALRIVSDFPREGNENLVIHHVCQL